MRQAGLFGLTEHLERLRRDGDPLEVLEATVDCISAAGLSRVSAMAMD